MNENEITDAEVVNATVELKDGVMPVKASEVSEEVQELAQLDPIAALLSNIPHKSRSLAESFLASMQDPDSRQRMERSEAEIARNLPPRVIRRDLREQRKFLMGRFWPTNGKREVERRLRNAAKSAK